MENISTSFLICVIAFLLIDFLSLSLALNRNLKIENRYYKFNQRYGLIRITILKVVVIAVAIGSMIASHINNVKVYWVISLWIAILGCNSTIVIFALLNIPKYPLNKNIQITSSIDSLTGLLVYPFEYLDTKKNYYSNPPRKFKWSWGAFFIPEYWYFRNEILGAGYLSWALLIAYLGLFNVHSFEIAVFTIILIRIISGLFGQRLYFAMFGKWA